MAKSKYQDCLSKEVIFKSKYPEISAPMISYRGDRYGTDLTFDWSCISKPLIINDMPKICDFDRVIFLYGSHPTDLSDFQASVEISLGRDEKKYLVNAPKFIYIPRGLTLGAINFQKVGKPISFLNFCLSSKFSQELSEEDIESDLGKFMTSPREMNGFIEIHAFHGGQKYREQKVADHELISIGKDAGGCNLCLFYYSSVDQAFLAPEPPHAHHFDMWNVFYGGNPMQADNFDAEVGFRFGEEAEGVLVDSPSVIHIPAEMIHRSIDYLRVTKPFNQINLFLSDTYFKDQVFSDKEDIKMSEGATS